MLETAGFKMRTPSAAKAPESVKVIYGEKKYLIWYT